MGRLNQNKVDHIIQTILHDYDDSKYINQMYYMSVCTMKYEKIRPLAKLSRHIEVTNTSKQRKTEGKSLSSVSVSF